MRLTIGELRQVIREVVEERTSLQEVDRTKLAGMYKQLGMRLKKMSLNTSPAEREELLSLIQGFPDQGMAERLFDYYQKKVKKLDTAFSHVSGAHRTPMMGAAGGHGMGIMPSHKRPRRAG